MSWNDTSRDYYLANNERFIGMYCRDNGAPVESVANVMDVDSLRLLILQTAYYVPNAHHAAPGWGHQPPIVVLGALHRGNIRTEGRFGFCRPTAFSRCVSCENKCAVRAGEIYLWMQTDSNGDFLDGITALPEGRRKSWHPWRISQDNNEQWVYPVPIGRDGTLPADVAAILIMHSRRLGLIDGDIWVPRTFD